MTSPRRVTALAIASMAVSFALALVAAVRITGPSIRPDEWGYLLNGQVLLGYEEVRVIVRNAPDGSRNTDHSVERFAYAFILMTFCSLLVLGALQLALGKRADHFIYG